MSVDRGYLTLASQDAWTYRTDELTIVLVESVKNPRIEVGTTRRIATGRPIVCLYDRVVCRVEFKDNNIANIGREIMRNVGMRTRIRSDLDCMCHTAGGCRRGRGERCSYRIVPSCCRRRASVGTVRSGS